MLSSSELRILIELLTKYIDSKPHSEKMALFLNTLKDKLLKQIK